MEILCPSISISPFSCAALIWSEFSWVIAFLIFPNALFPLNLGPITGKFGKHVSLTYLSTFFST